MSLKLDAIPMQDKPIYFYEVKPKKQPPQARFGNGGYGGYGA
jgi:hypothetical protein